MTLFLEVLRTTIASTIATATGVTAIAANDASTTTATTFIPATGASIVIYI